MVAYIRRLTVMDRGWVSEDSFKKGIALCQTIPGATAMQAAAYAGLRAAGPWGALAAYAAFGLPAFVLMVSLAAIYGRSHDLPAVVSLFSGLQVIVVALVAHAAVSFGRRYIRNRQDGVLAALSGLYLGAGGNPVIAILCSGGLAILVYRNLYRESRPTPAVGGGPMAWKALRPALLMIVLLFLALVLLFFFRRDLFSLSILMLKVDLFAFGGGYASVPLLFHEIVDVRHWLSSQTLMDGIALGQMTPGPIVITATFVGYLLAGMAGAVVGTLSIFAPSLIILLLVVPYFDLLEQSAVVQRALRGVLLSFVGLLLSVAIQFSLSAHWTILSVLLGIAAFIALWKKVNILWVVLVGAVVSVVLF